MGAIISTAIVILAVVNMGASRLLLRSDALSREQTVAWLILVWLVLLIGAVLAFQMSRENSVLIMISD